MIEKAKDWLRKQIVRSKKPRVGFIEKAKCWVTVPRFGWADLVGVVGCKCTLVMLPAESELLYARQSFRP